MAVVRRRTDSAHRGLHAVVENLARYPAKRFERRIASARRYFIGGSDARIVMGSGEAALLRLWREKRGEAEPEDLAGNLIVQLGLATEPLNRLQYRPCPYGRSAPRPASSGALDGRDPGRHRRAHWSGL
jgi:hypothetical protein